MSTRQITNTLKISIGTMTGLAGVKLQMGVSLCSSKAVITRRGCCRGRCPPANEIVVPVEGTGGMVSSPSTMTNTETSDMLRIAMIAMSISV
jgi:hypothetical protein